MLIGLQDAACLSRLRRLPAPKCFPPALVTTRRPLSKPRTVLPANRHTKLTLLHVFHTATLPIPVQKQTPFETQRLRIQRPRSATSRPVAAARPTIQGSKKHMVLSESIWSSRSVDRNRFILDQIPRRHQKHGRSGILHSAYVHLHRSSFHDHRVLHLYRTNESHARS